MIPSTKISQTLLEFGKDVISELPENHSKEEFEQVMKIIITVWNSVVIDKWENTNTHEQELLNSLNSMPKDFQLMIRRLVKRKHKKIPNDLRAVGNHWVRENGSELIFGCDARLDTNKVKL